MATLYQVRTLILLAVATQLLGYSCLIARPVRITIFIHGVTNVWPYLNFFNFSTFLSDKVETTLYAKTIELLRQDSYFWQNQVVQGLGLKLIESSNFKGDMSGIIAHIYRDMERSLEGHRYHDLYYTFGWSSLLSYQARLRGACSFYNQLSKSVAAFRAKGIEPIIRIIGFSHGGHVTLLLERIARERNERPFVIDEVWLLGSPVHRSTHNHLHSPLFNKVYNLYSYSDRVQNLDIFSTHLCFSKHKFKRKHKPCLPDKLVQVEYKITDIAKGKTSIPCCSPNESPSECFDVSRYKRIKSPGHIELWFFGWTPGFYRSTFALAPLPGLVLLPYFIHLIKQIEHHPHNPNKPYVIDYRPWLEQTIVRRKQCCTPLLVDGWLTQERLDRYKQEAQAAQPENFDRCTYKKRAAGTAAVAYDIYLQDFRQKREEKKERIMQEALTARLCKGLPYGKKICHCQLLCP